jgi:hypothetical protein
MSMANLKNGGEHIAPLQLNGHYLPPPPTERPLS